MRMLVLGVALATLPLGACSTTRSKVLGYEGAAADPLGVGAPPAVVAPPEEAASTGPVEAQSLARKNGLTLTDQGGSVLLAGQGVLARFYPGSDEMSLDGDKVRMDQPAQRSGADLWVPAFGARAVTRAIVEARGRRDRTRVPTIAYVPPPPPPPSALPPAPPAPQVKSAPVVEIVPTNWIPSARERAWKWIVIHHSDDHCGCAAKYDMCHRAKGWECLGYDWVIGNGSMSGDGQVEVGPRWTNQQTGAHAKTDDNRYNEAGIGIVLVGDFEHGGQPTRAQWNAAVRLTRWLMARYGIPASSVLRHADCKPTACPGRSFPWSKFLADVSSAAEPP